ncbi:MAG: S8 family serine peptidase [Limnohabitans sp.]|nr:S8 family serine peptidase [Limnohabitans sp.]
MKKIIFIALFFTCQFFGQSIKFQENQLILKINDAHLNQFNLNLNENKTGIKSLDGLNKENGLVKIESIGQFKKTKTFIFKFNKNISIDKLIEIYKATNFFDYVEPDYLAYGSGIQNKNVTTFPNDALFNRQWGLFNDGTFTVGGMSYTSVNDADVDMELAWDIETGDPNLIIAVSDTGLKMDHVDIASRIWTKTAEIIDGIDNDGNGLIDDRNGWDWVNSDNNPSDDHGHGTNCTGIIGAIANNSVGYCGANWNSKIMPLKVLNSSNSGTYSAMANSIYYAVDNGAKIISMSIGGSSASTAISNALDYAATNGVLFVACMMNFNNNTPYYPAAYAATKDNVIAVGSTNSNDRRTNPFFWSATSGSNYGNHITVVAPGEYTWGLGTASTTDYNSYWGGTSQATPLVAATASLLKSKSPSLTPLQIKNILKSTAQDQVGLSTEDTPGWDQYMGSGRINAYAALQQVITLSSDNFETFSENLSISNPCFDKKLKIFTSPSLRGYFDLSIITMDGKKIDTKLVNLKDSENGIDFNYPKGVYILTLKGENYTKVFKLMNY